MSETGSERPPDGAALPSKSAWSHPLRRILAGHPKDGPQGGYLFVPNLERIPGAVTLGPNAVLRRAAPQEIEDIRAAVDFIVGSWNRSPRPYPWDHRAIKHPETGGWRTEYEALAEDDRRYHVLEFQGTNMVSHDVIQASVLATGPEFVHGFELTWGPVTGYASGPDLSAFVESVAFEDDGFQSLSSSDATDLASVYARLGNLPWNHPLRGLIDESASLRTLGRHPRLRLLGRFSILESMLVHKPKPSDPHDSITRQVKAKMVLLDRRFRRPVRYDAFGGVAGLDTLWGKLYGLRSAVAHGNPPRFDKGEFEVLRSVEHADRLLASAVRSVLRQMLEEPDLLEDLREC